MANTLLTPSVIARQALANLYNNTVFLPLVHRDFDADFAGQVGDTVTVRKPAQFTAQNFTSTISVQDATETSVAVKLDQHLDVSFSITAKDLALSLRDFNAQLLNPAMEAIAQKVDKLLAGLYADVYNTVGTAGTTPSTKNDGVNVRKALNVAAVPMAGRRVVVDPTAEASLLLIDQWTQAFSVADGGQAIAEGALGRKYGMDFVMSQNVAAHSNGDIAHSGTFAVNGAVAAGAATMGVDATTLTGTWKKGSVFTVAGVTGSFVVTADATAAANAIASVAFAPAAPAGGFADNAVITRVASHTPNLGFHESAFAFVSRPLVAPMGVAPNMVHTEQYGGLGLRVVFGYNLSTKTDTCSVDLLCGVKTLDPVRAVRLLG